MSTPVTRGELREELKKLATRDELASKLETWGSALLARIQDGERATSQLILQSEQRLGAELARHVQAAQEENRVFFAALDDKYADLPGRVGRLERSVFRPKKS